ncbi:MAG: hypothetical protein QNK23_15725 [Crocinitomicaceae bacterium]|nr:hypothetical protein [Crocinitomicaceae bacterium]
MKKKLIIGAYLSFAALAFFVTSCQDDPITPNTGGGTGIDTTWTNPNDSTGGGGLPIDSTWTDPNGGGGTPNDSTWTDPSGGGNPSDSTGG